MPQERFGPREVYLGKELGRRDFAVTEQALGSYFGGLRLDPAWYRDRSPYGRPVAPSMAIAEIEDRFIAGAVINPFGTLWRRQEWSFFLPLFPGEGYPASARVLDIYRHRDRTIVAMQVVLKTAAGEIVAEGRHHQSFVVGQTAGRVKLREPGEKERARPFTVPEGEPLDPVRRTITLEMCRTFFHGELSYHTQRQRAEGMGFDNVVVGGRMTLGYLGDLMDRRFGRGWYEGGRLDVKFTNVVWPGDEIVASGVVTGRTKEAGGTRANVAVWLEKADGTVAIAGTASALE